MSNYIIGLDVGTSEIKAVTAEIKGGRFTVKEAIKRPSAGLRKGIITDTAEAARAITEVLDEIKKNHRGATNNIFVNIGGSRTNIQNAKGIIAVSRADNEIYKDDVDRVVKASHSLISISPNRTIIHTLNKDFIIDGTSDIENPIGLIGSRLEFNGLVIDAFSPNLKNITQSVESAGGSISSIIFGPLAASRSVLTKKQKDLGVVLIDIGAGTTSISVYEGGRPAHFAVLPIGSMNITNDLAIGFKMTITSAELLKLNFGSAIAKDVPAREVIDLKKIDFTSKNPIFRKQVADIIEARLSEIFEFVNHELRRVGLWGQLPAGAVLIGGGSQIKDIADLARAELKLPIKIGSILPESLGVFEETEGESVALVDDIEFASALGLALLGNEQNKKDFSPLPDISKNFFGNFLKNFLP